MQSKTNYRWIMLSMGWLTYFSFGLIYTAIAPLIAPIMLDLKLTYTQMGSVTGAWQLVYIFAAQPLGLMVDRLGTRNSLILGTIVISSSSILRGFATSYESLFASVALFGIGGPLVSIGTPKLISTYFSGRERGVASGINASGSSAGSMAALGLTNSLLLPIVGSWRNVFYVYGAFGFLITLIWLLFGKQSSLSKEYIDDPRERIGRQSKTRELLSKREIWLIVIIGVVSFLTSHGLQNWLPSILELRGLSPINAGFATSMMTLSSVIGSLVVPRFMYRKRRKASVIAAVLLFSGTSIILIGIGENVPLWVGIMSAGFFNGSIMPILTVTLMDMPEVGAERMGVVGGLFFSIGEIGGFLGPFMMGYLKDITGSFLSGIFFLTVAIWITIIATFFLKSENTALTQ